MRMVVRESPKEMFFHDFISAVLGVCESRQADVRQSALRTAYTKKHTARLAFAPSSRCQRQLRVGMPLMVPKGTGPVEGEACLRHDDVFWSRTAGPAVHSPVPRARRRQGNCRLSCTEDAFALSARSVLCRDILQTLRSTSVTQQSRQI